MTTTTVKERATTIDLDLKTIEDAPEGSRPHLERAKENFGFVPNLYRVFANNPVALESYVGIGDALAEHGSLSAAEQQLVMLTVSRYNDCHYCVAAHSTIGEQNGLSEASIEAIREDRSLDDPKLEALRRFTKAVVDQRGWLSDDAVSEFLDAGYEKEQVLEVYAITAMKTLSNYTNHLAATPLDRPFEAKRWQPAS